MKLQPLWSCPGGVEVLMFQGFLCFFGIQSMDLFDQKIKVLATHFLKTGPFKNYSRFMRRSVMVVVS